jgi:hypothetical protein
MKAGCRESGDQRADKIRFGFGHRFQHRERREANRLVGKLVVVAIHFGAFFVVTQRGQ